MVSVHDCDIDAMARTCSGFSLVHLCGNHGDPIYHPQFHDLIQKIKSSNPSVRFSMHTNAAFRSKKWWQKTASLFTGNDSITFSIDGLPSNNHVYRANSKWSSVHEAVTILRQHNDDIEMIWKWIVFRYNENDIEKGISLARELGFDRFLVIRSYRRDNCDPLTSTRSIEQLREQLNATGIC
jgi:hypothetical protein